MRVLIVTLGSRGDIQPYVALGKGLQAAGHQVTIATHCNAQAFVAEHGLLENPLRQIGFRSIGCAPCTRAVTDGEHERAGRWPGHTKTECGLHSDGSGI